MAPIWIGIAIALVATWLLLALRRPAEGKQHPWFSGLEPPLVIAHRGSVDTHPENTREAIHAAMATGVQIVECDIRRSRDNVWMVIHDETVDRTTDGSGPVAGKTCAELQGLDAGSRFTPDSGRSYPWRGRDARIPTLAEVINGMPGSTRLIVEIKDTSPDAVACLQSFLREMPCAERKVLLACFNHRVMREVRRALPQFATAGSSFETALFLAAAWLGCEGALPLRFEALSVPSHRRGIPVTTRIFLRAARRCRIPVYVWTINDVSKMRTLLARGADGILTDFPALALQKLEDPDFLPSPPGHPGPSP